MSNGTPPKPVVAVHTATGEVTHYPSIYAAAAHLDIDQTSIRQAVKRGRVCCQRRWVRPAEETTT